MTDDILDIPRQPGPDPVTPEPVTPEPVDEIATTETVPLPPVETAAGEADAGTDVTCPGCGVISRVYSSRRAANDFCGSCDYPLFWAVERVAPAAAEVGDSGLRRLPGTAGRAALAALRCPTCTEPNPPAAVFCVRCGSELRPAPAPEPVPEPVALEPEPMPEPEGWPWWAWALLVGVVVVTLAGVLLAIFL